MLVHAATRALVLTTQSTVTLAKTLTLPAPAGGPSPKEIVYLSVGGTPFTTRRSTLCRVPDSALAKLFALDNGPDKDKSGLRGPDKDKSGAYFLDRDPSVFAWVLCYLRLEQQLYDIPPPDMIRSVQMEADFWGLKGLVDILDASLAPPCLGDQRVEAVRFVNDGPDLSRLLDEDDTISDAVRRAIAAVYIRASEDTFGQPIFAAHGLSNLVLHMLSDGTATFWLVSESAAKTQDNLENSLLLCMSSANDSNHPFASYTGVWNVNMRSHPSEPGVFREMPELALRSVPRSIALSLEPDLEDLVDPGDVE